MPFFISRNIMLSITHIILITLFTGITLFMVVAFIIWFWSHSWYSTIDKSYEVI